MSLDSCLINDKGDIRKFSCFQQIEHVSVQVSLWHLHSNVEHPDIIKRQLTVVATKHIQLSFDDIGCVSAAGPWSVVTCLHLLPVVLLYVKHVHIVHPVSSIIASEIVNL